MQQNNTPNLLYLLRRRPHLFANIRGSRHYPDIHGTVRFYQSDFGVLVAADITGLPVSMGRCNDPIFGFHIHEGASCDESGAVPFANTKNHYNPDGCAHPNHAGDLPPLFGAGGRAFSLFLTDRFTVAEILARTVVIHSHPDDFTTQPAGGAGEKIACGVIERVRG